MRSTYYLRCATKVLHRPSHFPLQVLEGPEEARKISDEKREYMEKERNRQNEDVKEEQPFFREYAPKSK